MAGSSLRVFVAGPSDHGRGGPGGWWILDEPELHLSGDVLVPDIAGPFTDVELELSTLWADPPHASPSA